MDSNMSKELIGQLKSLKQAEVKPSELWLQKNRELLLSQIKNTVSENVEHKKFKSENVWQGLSIFLPQSIVYRVIRPAVAFVLIFALGLGGWAATVSASYEALPGDWLYAAKRAAEKTQVAVTDVVGDKNDVVKLHGELAKRRAIETKKIVSQNNPDKIAIAVKTVSDLKDEIKTINTKLEEIKTGSNTGAVAVKDINQSTQEIKGVLKEVRVNLLASNNQAETTDLSSQVSEVKNLVQDTAVKATEILVEKHLQGDTSVSKEEVKEVINTQLKSAAQDAAESNQNIAEVNKAVDVVKDEMASKVQAKATLVAPSDAKVISSQIDAASKQTQAAVNTAQQLNTEAGKTATEGQISLSQDKLTEAVDQLKKVNATTNQVEQITDTALKTVQTILPVVAVVVDAPITASLSATSTSTTIPVPVVTTTTSNTVQITTTPVIIPKPIIK